MPFIRGGSAAPGRGASPAAPSWI